MQIKTKCPQKNQSSYSLFLDRLNAYVKQVKVNEFLEEEIKSMFDNED